MPAPSKTWVTIADTQVDADSPLDTTLITGLRDDTVHLKEWLGKDYTAAQNHEHNGADSARISEANLSKSGGVAIWDDFLFDGLVGWENVSSGAATNLTALDNGSIRLTETTPNTFHGIKTGATRPFRIASGVTVTAEVKIKQSGTAFQYCVLGFVYGYNTALPAGIDYAVHFDRNNGGNWQAKTENNNSITTTTLDVAPSTSYQTLKIVATTSDVKFYVDGVLKATHTTNIPTVNLTPIFVIWSTTGAGLIADIDYVHIYSSARL